MMCKRRHGNGQQRESCKQHTLMLVLHDARLRIAKEKTQANMTNPVLVSFAK
jgi:hypothetical protein